MCGNFCIDFINYMLDGETLLDYTKLFSPNDFKKNDQIIEKYLKRENRDNLYKEIIMYLMLNYKHTFESISNDFSKLKPHNYNKQVKI